MKTDCFFHQGFTHEVCEDYAFNGTDYVVLSDGCSNAGGSRIHSDWGSRLMCLSAIELRHIGSPRFEDMLCGMLLSRLQAWQLSRDCISATLMLAMVQEDRINVRLCGDGVVGGKRKDGRWKIHQIDYPHGAPYYLKYRMYDENESWKECFGGQIRTKHWFGRLMSPDMSYPNECQYNERIIQWEKAMSLAEEQKDFNPKEPLLNFDFPLDEYEFIFMCTDGADSFLETRATETSKSLERVHLLDVLRVMVDVKSFLPGFAKLQRNWCFRQNRSGTFLTRKWNNQDDVSLGIIYCE